MAPTELKEARRKLGLSTAGPEETEMTMRYTVFLQINHRQDGKGRARFQVEPFEWPGQAINDGWGCAAVPPDIMHYSFASDSLDRLIKAAREMILTLGFHAAGNVPDLTATHIHTIELIRDPDVQNRAA